MDLNRDLLSTYAGERILVTGGASFIGSHLVEFLVELGARVTVADNFSSGSRQYLGNVSHDVEILVGDLRSADFADRAASGATTVFHLAALHGGRGYIDTHPVACLNNMVLDHVVFQSVATAGAERIIYASSACVYPVDLQASDSVRLLLAERDANFDERGMAFADGEYGWAKLMGEYQLRAFQRQFGIEAIAARIFTAYGERQNLSHAAIALIAKAVARMDPLPVWGDGKQTRNFTYVHDTVRGLALAGRLPGCQALNVGSSQHHSILELLDLIFNYLNWRPSELHFQLDRPIGVRSRASDNTRILELTNWQPSMALQDGVVKTIEWYAGLAAVKPETLELQLMTRLP